MHKCFYKDAGRQISRTRRKEEISTGDFFSSPFTTPLSESLVLPTAEILRSTGYGIETLEATQTATQAGNHSTTQTNAQTTIETTIETGTQGRTRTTTESTTGFTTETTTETGTETGTQSMTKGNNICPGNEGRDQNITEQMSLK